MSNSKYLDILKRYWGYDGFRGIQREIIESVGRGEDTLGLMPTGGGKSITFQVPTMAMDGLCLVITPLIALMKDQVLHLRQRGIKAAAIYTGMRNEEVIATLENCIFGGYKFLYVAPERLASSLFLTKLSRIHVSLITIDEAHCISQWGYDFRPSYLNLGRLRELLPGVPVLALTASATREVADDIQRQLHFARTNVHRMSFDRPNIVYVVRKVENIVGEMIHILTSTQGSAIVYCRSRAGVVELAEALNAAGISSSYYHAGLAPELRDRRQRDWTTDKVRVMVCTNAFGMGIDKADVRVVIHAGIPDSLEAYYQEAGRAGRDGQTSYAVMLYDRQHINVLRRRVAETFPERALIGNVYEHLCCYYQLAVDDGQGIRRALDMDKFCVTFHHFPVTVLSALHLLEQSGYIEFENSPGRASRFMFTLRRDELYRLRRFSGVGDQIMTALLRSYPGLFIDYQYINEQYLAETCGVSTEEVYGFLKTLSDRHIAQYVPMRETPMVTFLRRRVDTSKLHIPTEVYERRCDAMQRRIDAIIAYTSDTTCRGRAILEYFGEEAKSGCGHCDTCRRAKTKAESKILMPEIRRYLLDRMQTDGEPFDLASLVVAPYSTEDIKSAVQALLDDGEVRMYGTSIMRVAD